MEKKRTVSFEKLLQSVSLGNIEPEVISSIAVRMARILLLQGNALHERHRELQLGTIQLNG
jgi:hypothetical protein